MAENNSQKIYEYVRDMILSGELKAGRKISEQSLAELFSSSRTPVREALRKLDGEGLVTIYPKRFAQVSEISEKQIQDLGVLRLAIDQMAVRIAVLKGSRMDYLALEKTAQQCLDAFHENNHERRYELDAEFHRQIVEISGNEELLHVQNEISLKVRFILANRPYVQKNEEEHLQEHLQLVDALQHGNTNQALVICTNHLADFYNLGSIYPDHFFG